MDGQASGFGVYVYSKGAKNIGYWKNDVLNGPAREDLPDGSSFTGMFEGGMKHGYGEYVFADRGSYRGEWTKN